MRHHSGRDAAAAPAVRRLGEEDLPSVRRLMGTDPGAPRWSESHLRSFLANDREEKQQKQERTGWVVPTSAGERNAEGVAVLGFVAGSRVILPDGVESELEYIAVAREERGRGLGRLLLQELVDWAAAAGPGVLRLEVRSSNSPARALYSGAGFSSIGVRAGYYTHPNEDALLMEMMLPIR